MSSPVAPLFLGLLVSVSAFAAAPVSEIGSQPSQPVSAAAPKVQPVPAPAQPPTRDIHYQMQLLEDEVRTLRGLVEELNNEIRQQKKRQMDDYMDLDRRLSALTSAGVSGQSGQQRPPAASGAGTTTATEKPNMASVSPSASADESHHYEAAYKLLKDGKINEATAAFKSHIANYPNGKYVANAHYWLGEIYVLQNKLELARQSFTAVVDNYPIHRKAPDSTFKLGQVYFMLGNKAKAKEYLDKAASGNDNAARLAKGYLEKNF